jgi:hypothetical protein
MDGDFRPPTLPVNTPLPAVCGPTVPCRRPGRGSKTIRPLSNRLTCRFASEPFWYGNATGELPGCAAPQGRALGLSNAHHWCRKDTGFLTGYWSIRYSPNMSTLPGMLHFPLMEYALR